MALAVMHEPDLLLLDEPYSGFDCKTLIGGFPSSPCVMLRMRGQEDTRIMVAVRPTSLLAGPSR